jgi:hypothetical protein
MPASYCVRLYRFDTRIPTPGDGMTVDVYGPSKALAGWAASFGTGDAFGEQLVEFSDPDQNNRVSNVNAVSFRCGLPTEGDRDVVFAGLCAAGSQGAQRAGLAVQAAPFSVVALPGGCVRVPGAGRYSITPGALVFSVVTVARRVGWPVEGWPVRRPSGADANA